MFGRKPLLYFSIVVATVGFFGHWFIDSNPEQEKREQGLVDSERTGTNYSLSQTHPTGAKPSTDCRAGQYEFASFHLFDLC